MVERYTKDQCFLLTDGNWLGQITSETRANPVNENSASAPCISGSLGDIEEYLHINSSKNYVFLDKTTILPAFNPLVLKFKAFLTQNTFLSNLTKNNPEAS